MTKGQERSQLYLVIKNVDILLDGTIKKKPYALINSRLTLEGKESWINTKTKEAK